jgi:hypothetical protein
MIFDWDPNKAARNLQRHGVSFEQAAEVFDDPHALFAPDEEHSIGEQRFIAVGVSSAGLLFVVYAERREDVIRIIHTRPASRRHQQEYEENLFQSN